jgi:hypothetical protein
LEKKKGEEEKEKNPLKKKRVCVLHVLGDGRFDENFTFPISGHKSKCMAHLQKKKPMQSTQYSQLKGC